MVWLPWNYFSNNCKGGTDRADCKRNVEFKLMTHCLACLPAYTRQFTTHVLIASAPVNINPPHGRENWSSRREMDGTDQREYKKEMTTHFTFHTHGMQSGWKWGGNSSKHSTLQVFDDGVWIIDTISLFWILSKVNIKKWRFGSVSASAFR